MNEGRGEDFSMAPRQCRAITALLITACQSRSALNDQVEAAPMGQRMRWGKNKLMYVLY